MLQKRIPPLLAIAIIVILCAGAYSVSGVHVNKTHVNIHDRDIVITAERRGHILYGDAKGGGHLYGVNRPCKSEFPASWDAAEIIQTVRQIAANDNLSWQQQNNGYYVAEDEHKSIDVRVVLGPQQTKVITAYPVNVKRNPCPKNTP